MRVPAKAAPEAVIRVVRRFANERQPAESFRGWLDRSGGAAAIVADLKELDAFPNPLDAPDYYVDWDELDPFDVVLGQSECA